MDVPSWAELQFGHGVAAVENPSRPPPSCGGWKALQFGHGVAAVENVKERVKSMRDGWLQFGHGVAAVENATPRG